MGIIIYNGRSSRDYHIQVEHPPGYELPEKDYESVHIPGRNGDFIIDRGSYKNVDRTYTISIGDVDRNFPSMAHDIAVWLSSARTYTRLEDSYEPNYYRLAIYTQEADIENILSHGARSDITFNCKPQRFLKIGDKAQTFTKAEVIKNPTNFESRPIITVHGSGSGTAMIGNYTVVISDIKTSIIIDSEIQDAYSGETNRNPDVTLSDGFPILPPGFTTISFNGGITSVEVIPKWWTL